MVPKTNLFGLTLADLQQICNDEKMPKFAAKHNGRLVVQKTFKLYRRDDQPFA